jgi:tRNA dimethylallyltransferase
VERALNVVELTDSRREFRNTDREPLLVVVLGPTASGKTALALAIARRFQGEIVNCDSVAIYREFDVGTAKPTAAERAEIPHHLLDCVDPLADVSAGEYARQARLILREIASRKSASRKKASPTEVSPRNASPTEDLPKNASRQSEPRSNLPIVSGGTGLYLRALLDGLFAGPQRSEELRHRLRARASQHGAEYLHSILRRLDAAAADRIHANDIPKVIRAVEVCLASRRTAAQPSPPTSSRTSPRSLPRNMTELWQQGREPLQGFRVLRLGLNPERETLYARINQRAAKMFDEERHDGGLIAETERLLAKHGDQARPLTSLGYKHALQFLRGGLDRESALAAAQQAHRNYAKRQMTWFRREPDVHWLTGFGDDAEIQAKALAIIESEM